jgi:hypothetical protein
VYEQIGAGGMATVHRAEQRGIAGFRRVVALKRLHENVATDPDLLQSFFREARLASYLRHANVAQTFELGKVDETYFIAMEYVPGPTLAQLMRQCATTVGPIPLAVAIDLLTQICDGLEHAHNLCDETGQHLGIVHRDISPSNVIVSATGVAKLIDFGIAKATDSDHRTQTGMIKGKFGYLAPEYLAGRLDSRSDLFGVGVIAHEMLTGRALFVGQNDFDTLNRLRHMAIPPPSRWNPEVTRDLDDIVLTALQRNPDRRWQTAGAMRTALHNAARDLGLVVSRQQLVEWVAWVFHQVPQPGQPPTRALLDDLDEPSKMIEIGDAAPSAPAGGRGGSVEARTVAGRRGAGSARGSHGARGEPSPVAGSPRVAPGEEEPAEREETAAWSRQGVASAVGGGRRAAATAPSAAGGGPPVAAGRSVAGGGGPGAALAASPVPLGTEPAGHLATGGRAPPRAESAGATAPAWVPTAGMPTLDAARGGGPPPLPDSAAARSGAADANGSGAPTGPTAPTLVPDVDSTIRAAPAVGRGPVPLGGDGRELDEARGRPVGPAAWRADVRRLSHDWADAETRDASLPSRVLRSLQGAAEAAEARSRRSAAIDAVAPVADAPDDETRLRQRRTDASLPAPPDREPRRSGVVASVAGSNDDGASTVDGVGRGPRSGSPAAVAASAGAAWEGPPETTTHPRAAAAPSGAISQAHGAEGAASSALGLDVEAVALDARHLVDSGDVSARRRGAADLAAAALDGPEDATAMRPRRLAQGRAHAVPRARGAVLDDSAAVEEGDLTIARDRDAVGRAPRDDSARGGDDAEGSGRARRAGPGQVADGALRGEDDAGAGRAWLARGAGASAMAGPAEVDGLARAHRDGGEHDESALRGERAGSARRTGAAVTPGELHSGLSEHRADASAAPATRGGARAPVDELARDRGRDGAQHDASHGAEAAIAARERPPAAGAAADRDSAQDPELALRTPPYAVSPAHVRAGSLLPARPARAAPPLARAKPSSTSPPAERARLAAPAPPQVRGAAPPAPPQVRAAVAPAPPQVRGTAPPTLSPPRAGGASLPPRAHAEAALPALARAGANDEPPRGSAMDRSTGESLRSASLEEDARGELRSSREEVASPAYRAEAHGSTPRVTAAVGAHEPSAARMPPAEVSARGPLHGAGAAAGGPEATGAGWPAFEGALDPWTASAQSNGGPAARAQRSPWGASGEAPPRGAPRSLADLAAAQPDVWGAAVSGADDEHRIRGRSQAAEPGAVDPDPDARSPDARAIAAGVAAGSPRDARVVARSAASPSGASPAATAPRAAVPVSRGARATTGVELVPASSSQARSPRSSSGDGESPRARERWLLGFLLLVAAVGGAVAAYYLGFALDL